MVILRPLDHAATTRLLSSHVCNGYCGCKLVQSDIAAKAWEGQASAFCLICLNDLSGSIAILSVGGSGDPCVKRDLAGDLPVYGVAERVGRPKRQDPRNPLSQKRQKASRPRRLKCRCLCLVAAGERVGQGPPDRRQGSNMCCAVRPAISNQRRITQQARAMKRPTLPQPCGSALQRAGVGR